METRRAVLTLGDLLEDRSLGLALRTGPADAAERPVLGAAVVEVESPGSWIERGWVMLTAGVRLAGGSPEALRALAAECDAAGVAALGFGIGPVFDELPGALLEEGEARGLPIFAVPLETPRRSQSCTSRCWPMHETAAAASEIPRW